MDRLYWHIYLKNMQRCKTYYFIYLIIILKQDLIAFKALELDVYLTPLTDHLGYRYSTYLCYSKHYMHMPPHLKSHKHLQSIRTVAYSPHIDERIPGCDLVQPIKCCGPDEGIPPSVGVCPPVLWHDHPRGFGKSFRLNML